MPISSLVVRTIKSKLPEIVATLKGYAEIGLMDVEQNNIHLITKTINSIADADLWENIKKIPGVISCEMTYHHQEKGVL